MVNYPPIRFLWHSIIKAAITRLHVNHGNSKAPGHERNETAISVSENKAGVGHPCFQDGLPSLEQLAKLGTKRHAGQSQMMIGNSSQVFEQFHEASQDLP